MASLTCTAEARDGVTLVTARIRGGPVAQRVRLADRLDGPVWSPRRRGVPEAGWRDDRFETVVPAGGTVALGYATPAPAADPPLAVVDSEVLPEGDVDPVPTPERAIRDLGDPRPPRAAIPTPTERRPVTAHPPATPERYP